MHQTVHDMRQSRVRVFADSGRDRIDGPFFCEIIDFLIFGHWVSFVINVPGVVSR